MTIGTSTFYTRTGLFAIEIFDFLKYFFEFFVNSCLFLLKINKFLKFCICQKNLCMLNSARIFSVFGTKTQLPLCSNSQIAFCFFTLHKINSVKKTKSRFVKKSIYSIAKFNQGFLVKLTP